MKPNSEEGQTILALKVDLLVCHGFKRQTLRVTAYQTQFNNHKIILKSNARLNMTFLEYTQNWRWWCINKWM